MKNNFSYNAVKKNKKKSNLHPVEKELVSLLVE